MSEEVKTSWSMKFISLTIFLSLLTGVVGYGLRFIFEPKPKKIISLSEEMSKNLVGLDERAKSGIIADFKLKSTPNEQLKSYFEYKVRVKNSGDIGVENLIIFVDSTDSNIVIVEPPIIKTIPDNIILGMSIVKSTATQNKGPVPWNIPLLNPGEIVEFSFSAYSTVLLDTVKITTLPRKKDWEIIKEGEVAKHQAQSFLSKNISDLTGVDIFGIAVMFIVIQMVFNLYMVLVMRTPVMRRIFKRWGDMSQK